MIARIINCTVTPSKVGEFRMLLNNTLLPKIQSQHGFVENIYGTVLQYHAVEESLRR